MQAQSILRDSLLTTKNFADSLGHALIFAQGGNELLLEAHEDLQARLLELDDELEQTRGSLSSTRSDLNSSTAKLEKEKEELQTALTTLKDAYQEQVAVFQGKLDAAAESFSRDSVLLDKIDIRIRSGSLSIIVQEDRLFRRNSANRLSSRASDILRPIADLLLREPLLELTVIGHTDNQQPTRRDSDNWTFAALRSASLAAELTDAYYASANRVTAASAGEFSPFQSNATEEGRKANRRIEFRFSNNLTTFLRELTALGEGAQE
ncbi:MAG: OmpA family protein [Bacteroidota bacterium]